MSLEQLVARQAGVLALQQAVRSGMSAATVHRRVRTGLWERLYRAVYLVGGHRLTDEARVRAAWLWAGEQAAVSGAAAAYWHGLLDRAPAEVEAPVPRRNGPGCRPGALVRRRDLLAADLVRIRDVWLTDVPLTVLETAVALRDGSVFLDRALQRRVRFTAVYRAFCRNMGRRGSSAAGRLLVAAARPRGLGRRAAPGAHPARCRHHGWVLGHPFGPWRIDLAFPVQKVAVEVDGWAWHVDPERFRADRRKQNALVRDGWDPLRFTWHDLDSAAQSSISGQRGAAALPSARSRRCTMSAPGGRVAPVAADAHRDAPSRGDV